MDLISHRPRPRPSALGSKLIEPLTALLLSIGIVLADHSVILPLIPLATLTHLPALAAWDAWMSLHADTAAGYALFLPWTMLCIHNAREWRRLQPGKVRQRKVKPPDFFPRVRERHLQLPQVPSVQALAMHFRRHYGVG